jgi:DsbC/DsbD-like thiol-disulfide interchange protein
MKTRSRLLTSVLLFTVTVSATAQFLNKAADDSPVQMSLAADTTAAQPGKSFMVGALFNMKDEWHIYWQNPGEAGLPTSVSLTADSPGVTIESVQYPAPIMFMAPGDIVSYGYDHQVLLIAKVNVAASVQTKEVAITAKAKWLMCRENCVQAKDEKVLKIPVGTGSQANSDLFGRYSALLPSRQADPGVKAEKKVEGDVAKLLVTVTPDSGTMVAQNTGELRKLFFFPYQIRGARVTPIMPPEGDTSEKIGASEVKCHTKPVTVGYEISASNQSKIPGPSAGVLVVQRLDGQKVAPVRVMEIIP